MGRRNQPLASRTEYIFLFELWLEIQETERFRVTFLLENLVANQKLIDSLSLLLMFSF